jgi:hypothetical protein
MIPLAFHSSISQYGTPLFRYQPTQDLKACLRNFLPYHSRRLENSPTPFSHSNLPMKRKVRRSTLPGSDLPRSASDRRQNRGSPRLIQARQTACDEKVPIVLIMEEHAVRSSKRHAVEVRHERPEKPAVNEGRTRPVTLLITGYRSEDSAHRTEDIRLGGKSEEGRCRSVLSAWM